MKTIVVLFSEEDSSRLMSFLIYTSPKYLYDESIDVARSETEFAVWNRIAPGIGIEFSQNQPIYDHTLSIFFRVIYSAEILREGNRNGVGSEKLSTMLASSNRNE